MEPFRTRVESSPEVQSPLTTGPVQPEAKSVEARTNEYAGDVVERIDVYETERGHKYAEDFFGIRELCAGDWKTRMDMSRIDKYVKNEIQTKGYDSTITLYKNIINDLEERIGSKNLPATKRLQKLVTYIGILQKVDRATALKRRFLGGDESFLPPEV
jgi:hypothetical protein